MKRTQIYLTDKEHDYLKKEAEILGISKAELIRRVLDSHIIKDKDKK